MSETTPPAATPATTTAPAVDPSALLELLDSLVPLAGAHLVSDINGNTYDIPSALPARRQIAVMRAMEPLKTAAERHPALKALFTDRAPSDAQDGAGAEGAGEGTPAARPSLLRRLGAALYAVAGDDEVLRAIEAAFEAAHPTVVHKARTAAMETDGGASQTSAPADLFAVEELVGGLLPFFAQLARSAATALGTASTLTARR